MKNKPEWLEQALAGHPVETYGGAVGHVVAFDEESSYPLTVKFVDVIEIVGGCVSAACYTEHGDMAKGSLGEYPDMDIKGLHGEPAVFDYWDMLDDDIKYLAKDKDGEWYGYTTAPSVKIDGYFDIGVEGGTFRLRAIDQRFFPECNWKHSLIKRPAGESK